MHRQGFLAAVVLGIVAATLSVLGATGPAAAASGAGPGRVGPGTLMVTAGRSCSASFVFRDARGRVLLGYAASCATRAAVTDANACQARSLPLGTRVRLADGGRLVGYGVLRYSSLRALRRAGVTDAATCAANDFALVEVRGAARRLVSPSVPFWGGPSGVGALPATGSTVFGLARPSAAGRTLPRAGEVGAVTGSRAAVSTPLPGTGVERGSGFLDSAGRAVGILTAPSAAGDNVVASLADAVDYARRHGVPGLRLVRGADAFGGAAVL